jgi:hypothetical protein
VIPVEESIGERRKDSDYVKAYDALEEEFSLAAAMVQARGHAGLTRKACGAHAHDTSGDRTARKRQGEAVDTPARTSGGSDRDAGEGISFEPAAAM